MLRSNGIQTKEDYFLWKVKDIITTTEAKGEM